VIIVIFLYNPGTRYNEKYKYDIKHIFLFDTLWQSLGPFGGEGEPKSNSNAIKKRVLLSFSFFNRAGDLRSVVYLVNTNTDMAEIVESKQIT
jgi:hypothetical protein